MTVAYQSHSDTSHAATGIVSQSIKERVYSFIQLAGTHGMTGHEIADQLNIATASASGRLRELRLENRIRKSPERRGYSIRPGVIVQSNVWKLPEYVEVEADAKRDKAREALKVVSELRRLNDLTLDAIACLNKVYDVLK